MYNNNVINMHETYIIEIKYEIKCHLKKMTQINFIHVLFGSIYFNLIPHEKSFNSNQNDS